MARTLRYLSRRDGNHHGNAIVFWIGTDGKERAGGVELSKIEIQDCCITNCVSDSGAIVIFTMSFFTVNSPPNIHDCYFKNNKIYEDGESKGKSSVIGWLASGAYMTPFFRKEIFEADNKLEDNEPPHYYQEQFYY